MGRRSAVIDVDEAEDLADQVEEKVEESLDSTQVADESLGALHKTGEAFTPVNGMASGLANEDAPLFDKPGQQVRVEVKAGQVFLRFPVATNEFSMSRAGAMLLSDLLKAHAKAMPK